MQRLVFLDTVYVYIIILPCSSCSILKYIVNCLRRWSAEMLHCACDFRVYRTWLVTVTILKCLLLYSCAILLCSELSSWGIHLGMSCDHGIMFAAWVFMNREALLLNPVSYGTVNSLWVSKPLAPCGLRGCKNRPAPFPGRMSYKVTKLDLVCPSYLSMLYYCIVVY